MGHAEHERCADGQGSRYVVSGNEDVILKNGGHHDENEPDEHRHPDAGHDPSTKIGAKQGEARVIPVQLVPPCKPESDNSQYEISEWNDPLMVLGDPIPGWIKRSLLRLPIDLLPAVRRKFEKAGNDKGPPKDRVYDSP